MKIVNLLTLILIILCSSSIAIAQTSEIRSNDIIQEKVKKSSWQYYEININKPSKLTVKLRKISKDVDLYVARNDKPTKEDFLCAPLKSGKQIETCRMTILTPGKLYVGIYGKLESKYQLGVETKDMKFLSQINDKLN
jgi:hypothetical protein